MAGRIRRRARTPPGPPLVSTEAGPSCALAITSPTLSIRLEGDTYAVAASNARFVELFIDPPALTEWTYRKDAVPDGGSTHHIHWVRTPGPIAHEVVAWWDERP